MAKQERSKGKSYQDNSQQENYLDGQTRGTTKNIGKTGEKLEIVERKMIRGKKNRNNHRERRNQKRKIRS